MNLKELIKKKSIFSLHEIGNLKSAKKEVFLQLYPSHETTYWYRAGDTSVLLWKNYVIINFLGKSPNINSELEMFGYQNFTLSAPHLSD